MSRSFPSGTHQGSSSIAAAIEANRTVRTAQAQAQTSGINPNIREQVRERIRHKRLYHKARQQAQDEYLKSSSQLNSSTPRSGVPVLTSILPNSTTWQTCLYQTMREINNNHNINQDGTNSNGNVNGTRSYRTDIDDDDLVDRSNDPLTSDSDPLGGGGIEDGPHFPQRPESLDYIWHARLEWERRLRFELKAISKRQNRPLIQQRRSSEDDDEDETLLIYDKNGQPIRLNLPEPSNDFQVRFVFTSEDLLEVLMSIKNTNQASNVQRAPNTTATRGGTSSSSSPPSIGHPWGLISLELPVLSTSQLARKYSSLHPSQRQIGIDDTVLGHEWYGHERMRQGEELLKDTKVSLHTLRHFAQTGLHPSLRPNFYARMLGISLPLSLEERKVYQTLQEDVSKWNLLTDDLLQFDVQDGPGDDEAFFVFHETLQEMLLIFSRDSTIRTSTSLLINSAPIGLKKATTSAASAAASSNQQHDNNKKKGSSSSDMLDALPPNRIIPFHRLAYLATPFCFLYSQTCDSYFVFRAMYTRLLCRLSIVSSAPSTILSLSRCFETLLVQRSPQIVYKCLQLGIQPLACGPFGWMFSAFSGYLELEELFLLWDRLLGFDNLELLPILSVAIFLWREKSILAATTRLEIQEVMRELANIKVVPLLQYFLFAQ